MKDMAMKDVPSRLLKWFVIIFLCSPMLFLIMLMIGLGFNYFITIGKIFLFIAPIVIAIFMALFLIQYRRLVSITSGLDNESDADADGDKGDDKFINSFCYRSSGFILIANFLGGGIVIYLGYHLEVLLSVQHGFFFGLLAVFNAFIFGDIYYYMSKILLYPYSRYLSFRPMTMFEKLAIPVMTSILILLSFSSIGIYRVTNNNVNSLRTGNIEGNISKSHIKLNSFYERVLVELEAYGKSPVVRDLEEGKIQKFLLDLEREKKNRNILIYFFAYPDGRYFTSIGKKGNIGNREYFKEVFKTGKTVFSEPVISKSTGKEIIVCAVPVKRGKLTAGLIAATIRIDDLKNHLAEEKITETSRYIILSDEGKILFHPEKDMMGKVVGRDIKDDGKKFKDVERLLSAKRKTFFRLTLNGMKMTGYRSEPLINGQNLVLVLSRYDFMRELNTVMVQIIIALFILTSVIICVILVLTSKFSKPIHNMIEIFQKLSEGDLRKSSTDYLADEFGDLISSFNLFQGKIRETIDQVLSSATQLSVASEELAATSNHLSDSAQGQAASIEETSASLEEVSSSIEMISGHAREQSECSRATHRSMEELKEDNRVVVNFAGQALDKARDTTSEANTGNELMQKTISGMDKIDSSTKKIAETVGMISDISEQVNLLALNASIEAARAGEHGKGFAVVAEEISKLADKTASSAKDISSLVESGLREVNLGREYVDATSRALLNIIEFIEQTEEVVKNITDSSGKQAESSNRVVEDTKKVMEMSDNISKSTSEQMNANREMANTVEQINEATQGVASGAEEIASSSEEISAQAESLKQQIDFFKV